MIMILKTTGNEPGNLISIQCLLIIALMIQVVAVSDSTEKNTMKNLIALSPFSFNKWSPNTRTKSHTN